MNKPLTDSGTTGLSTEDVVTVSKPSIPNQEFYVVSSDAQETVLLAKYNLLVGDIYEKNGSTYTLIKTLSASDEGYGLQNVTAKGYDGTNHWVGTVAFSGTNYWDDEVCQYTGATLECTGISNLKNEYAIGGASYTSHNLPSLYRSDMSNVIPTLDYSLGLGIAQNLPYTIAYYVEQYINKLGTNGTARLLTTNELLNVGCTTEGNGNYNCSNALSWFLNDYSFWLGNALNHYAVSSIENNSYGVTRFAWAYYCGVRPVIVVPTSSIQTS